jgi:hypothetical protein
MTMKRTTAFLAAAILIAVCSAAYAVYGVSSEGRWPKSWPKELEPLRKQSTTFVGPEIESLHYFVPFTNRKDFESAWPHILKVKTKGAPLFLLRSPYTWLGRMDAGVLVHCPPAGAKPEVVPPGEGGNMYRLLKANYIELVVDGKIVDLNRIPLPADTPIIDRRFEEPPKKSAKRASSKAAPHAPSISPAPPASEGPPPAASHLGGG